MFLDDTTPLKTCTKCGESKPATSEFFRRNKRRSDGWQDWCKACAIVYETTYKIANRERILAKKRADHWKNAERNRARSRAYHVANKERLNEYRRVYWNANRERFSEERRERRKIDGEKEREKARVRYWKNPEKRRQASLIYAENHREEARQRALDWRNANLERARESDRARYESRKKWRIAWKSANPEKIRAINLNRHARKKNAEGMHTAADIQAQYQRQKGHCYWCGVNVYGSYHVDHIVPLSRGGSNWPENLVIACPSCNSSKKDKLPHEWIEGGRLI